MALGGSALTGLRLGARSAIRVLLAVTERDSLWQPGLSSEVLPVGAPQVEFEPPQPGIGGDRQRCQPLRGRIGAPARRNSFVRVHWCTPNSLATTASDAPCSYRAAASATDSSVIFRTTRRRAMPARSRWWMTVVLWTWYRQGSASIEAPSGYRWISCSISVADSRRCTGFESRPFSSRPPAIGGENGGLAAFERVRLGGGAVKG